jgi:excisionase family DNA binding protein
MKEFCTIQEAADFLGVSRSTISRWIKTGRLGVICPSGTPQGHKLIRRKRLEELLLEEKAVG